jgi:hypothetical protein
MDVLLGLAFAVCFVGMWCLVEWILSRASGWQELAERFHDRGTFRGRRYRFRSGRMNGVWFRMCLNVGMNEHGLHLVPTLLFRPFHRPLLIPWGEIELENHKWLIFSHTAIRFRSCSGIDLVLYGRAFRNATEYVAAAGDANSAGEPVQPHASQ